MPAEAAQVGEPLLEVLYWVGCLGSFDARNQRIARSLAEIFKEAGVKFAILGKEESCCGDPARRPGNEYLFQTLAQVNIEIMNTYGVRKVITSCPHCFNTIKNEYPQFGGNYDVVHHSRVHRLPDQRGPHHAGEPRWSRP